MTYCVQILKVNIGPVLSNCIERTTNECGDTGTGEWFLTENAFIPGGTIEPDVLRNISSSASCILECQEWSKYCYIIVYDQSLQTCLWYDESPSHNYKRFVFDANQVVLSRLCASGTCKKDARRLYGFRNFKAYFYRSFQISESLTASSERGLHIKKSRPEVIRYFSCSTKLGMKF